MPPKTVPYDEIKGKRYRDLLACGDLLGRLGAGALHDARLTGDIFKILVRDFPVPELRLIDLTVRMFTEPCLEGDIDKLGEIWTKENNRKNGCLSALGVCKKAINSNQTFIELLEAEGVDVAYKDGKNGKIPAFGRNDAFMQELAESGDERISLLAQARLGLRSTIDQTRAERLGDMATRGRLPVYLRYCGAHTGRWSGGDQVNWQNFRRGGELRKAICAPQGARLVIVDSSQIECRILNCFAGQADVIHKFITGADPYVGIASIAYGRHITKEDKAERGTGKQLELSCGYGAGAKTIQRTAKLGIYGPPVTISLDTANYWKEVYRQTHPYVVNCWRVAEGMLSKMHIGHGGEWNCFFISNKRIALPGCLPLIYDTLTWDKDWKSWTIVTRRGMKTKLYGAKLIENVVQYMARQYLAEAMLRISRYGIRIATTTHDEIVAVVPVDSAEQARSIMVKEMTTPPDWMSELPLACEAVISERYEK
jgi:DNA polymerase